MARLASQMKQGFHPCPSPVIDLILQHLRPPIWNPASQLYKPEHVCVLDPCAGEGEAISQLALGLGLQADQVFACELNTARAARFREACPDVKLLGPCSLFAAKFSSHCFSLVYLNPPFDDELGGGGREELAFLREATRAIAFGGILVMVLPLNQVYGAERMCTALDAYYDATEVYLFPPEHRKFGECVVIARRRKQTRTAEERASEGPLGIRGWKRGYLYREDEARFPVLGTPGYAQWRVSDHTGGGLPVPSSRRTDLTTWTVPFSWPPKVWEKGGLTDDELEAELEHSPLYAVLDAVTERAFKRPPLSLNKGHTSLLALTGLLDGYVPSNPPHVVRGYCGKLGAVSRRESYTTDSGKSVEKTVYAELPNPIVRIAWPDGRLETLGAPEAATSNVELEQPVLEEEDE